MENSKAIFCIKSERDRTGLQQFIQAVLEIRISSFGSQSTCQLLIQSLCKMGQRQVAALAFGSDLVEFVEPI